MSYEQEAAKMLAPPGGGAAPLLEDRLAGTGTTEDNNTTGLHVGAMATLLVGNVAVRVSFENATGLSTKVATTDPIIAANSRFDWLVTPETAFVYVEAADGSSAYECWVWQSSDGMY